MTTKTATAYGTTTGVVHIDPIWCNGCGVPYGLPRGFLKQRREDHQTWTCPNGCERHYPVGSSDVEKKAKALEEEKTRLQQQLTWAREDRDRQRAGRLTAERRRAAAKGQLTKTKNRIANGVCPCCNRTFVNLGKHMAGKHPDYAPGVES
jgi:uncharacterized Zn-finger protein